MSPQTAPSNRKKGHYCQITELVPAITVYAIEKWHPLQQAASFHQTRGIGRVSSEG
ncbi:MAG: hypothetical protein LUQ12_05455 [Methanoregulaceae archaeon]|nr:hypothetical protein [Methanoregulaceae archaeon]